MDGLAQILNLEPPDESARAELVALWRLLCRVPAGSWATSSAGLAPLAAACHERRYGAVEPSAVSEMHWTEVARRVDACDVAVLGVPFDGGSFGMRGACSGPTGLRAVWDPIDRVIDLGDLHVVPQLFEDDLLSSEVLDALRLARFGPQSAPLPVSPLTALQVLSSACQDAGLPVITVGGDHSISASTISAFRGRRFAVLHLDAHDDLGVARDGVLLSHSSWLKTLQDRGSTPSLVLQFGMPHDFARGEWLGDALVRIPMPSNSDDLPGIVAAQVAAALARAEVSELYVSIDVDCLRAADAPCTNLPSFSGGLQLASVLSIIAMVGESAEIIGGDVVEAAPSLGGRSFAEDVTSLTVGAIVDALSEAIVKGSERERRAGEAH